MLTIIEKLKMSIWLYTEKIKEKLKIVACMSVKIAFNELVKEVIKWLIKIAVSYFRSM